MGDYKLATRRARAVGTRDRVLSRLAQAGEIRDESGMASAVLARQIGYPGSSIAFAQLLSGMERSGLIRREVRGKRTYRIALVAVPPPDLDGAANGTLAPGGATANGTASSPHSEAAEPAGPERGAGVTARELTAGLGGFDYDELARRLLIRLIRQLAAPGQAVPLDAARGAPPGAGRAKTVADLEQELASVKTLQGTLIAENARLTEQLREARRRLALAEGRARLAVTEQLDGGEISLLERLLFGGAADS